jgi:hypothetical protein
MGVIFHLIQIVTQLEEKSASLRNTRLGQNGISRPSNQLNSNIAEQGEIWEEDIAQHFFEAMKRGDLQLEHFVHGMEEATNYNIFLVNVCISKFC